jgi:hypothetical protein
MIGKPKNKLWNNFVNVITLPPVSFTIIWLMMDVYSEARGFKEPGEDLGLFDLGLALCLVFWMSQKGARK